MHRSYLEFAQHVLPRIKAAGYTAVQLMAVGPLLRLFHKPHSGLV